MPDIETAWRFQKAVLWKRRDVYDDYGRPTLHSPVEIDVRYEEGKREKLGPQGEPIGSTTQVVVDRYIPVGSIMWLGALADIPNPEIELKQVINYEAVPDVKGRRVRREVTLANYVDTTLTLETGTGS